MKRFILILAVLLLTNVSANAVYYRSIGGIGRPTHVMTPSGHMKSLNNFGSNAAFLPHNRIAAGQRMRMREHMKYTRVHNHDRFARPYGYYNHGYGVGPARAVVRSVPPSRFNRNYQITSQSRSYTRNGITYFD
jgi:hypothetical protein